jgi:poly-gamma-glutamate synthesis protein (capsule biosynthesis protein)
MRSVRPVTAYGSSDDRSMAADNTSAFNCRRAVAPGRRPGRTTPTAGRSTSTRSRTRTSSRGACCRRTAARSPTGSRRAGKIRRGDTVHRAFRAAGFAWGGDFSSPDYQHFDR